MGFDLTGTQIKDTYQKLVLISGSVLGDGVGTDINFLTVTASFALSSSADNLNLQQVTDNGNVTSNDISASNFIVPTGNVFYTDYDNAAGFNNAVFSFYNTTGTISNQGNTYLILNEADSRIDVYQDLNVKTGKTLTLTEANTLLSGSRAVLAELSSSVILVEGDDTVDRVLKVVATDSGGGTMIIADFLGDYTGGGASTNMQLRNSSAQGSDLRLTAQRGEARLFLTAASGYTGSVEGALGLSVRTGVSGGDLELKATNGNWKGIAANDAELRANAGNISLIPQAVAARYVKIGSLTTQTHQLTGSLDISTALTASGLFYPTSDGTTGQVLTTDGAGNLTFGDASISASYAGTAGYALQAGTSGFATSASWADQSGTSGYAESALSSSYAVTASFALNAAGGAGFPYEGAAEITGSLVILVSGSNDAYSIVSASYSGQAIDNLTTPTASDAIRHVVALSLADYGAITTPDPQTLYVINDDTGSLVLGDTIISGSLGVRDLTSLNGGVQVSGSQTGLLVDNEVYSILVKQTTDSTTPNFLVGAQDPSMNGLNTGIGINNVVLGSGEFTSDVKGIRPGAGDSNILAGGWGGVINKGSYNAVIGGGINTIEDSGSAVINTATVYNAMIGGENNVIGTRTQYGAILGGKGNQMLQIGTNGSLYGLMGGQNNIISGSDWATVVGANNKITFGNYSSIIGGNSNTITFASNTSAYSAILGGSGNSVTHARSVVLGGQNLASSRTSEVVVPNLSVYGTGSITGPLVQGGDPTSNTTNGTNVAIAATASVSDGDYTAVIASENSDTGNGQYTAIMGGKGHSISDGSNWSIIVGGESNTISGGVGVAGIFGGYSNDVSGFKGYIVGSENGSVNGSYSAIFGSVNGTINNANSVIIGGENATINAAYCGNFVAPATTISNGDTSVALGGYQHSLQGNRTFILGGQQNTVQNITSGYEHLGGIIGGKNNTVVTDHTSSVIIGGTALSTQRADEVVVPSLTISGSTTIGGGILQMDNWATLPAAASYPNAFAVSGSKPFFSDGTSWNALY